MTILLKVQEGSLNEIDLEKEQQESLTKQWIEEILGLEVQRLEVLGLEIQGLEAQGVVSMDQELIQGI